MRRFTVRTGTRNRVLIGIGICMIAAILFFRTSLLVIISPFERVLTATSSSIGSIWTGLFRGAEESARADACEAQRNTFAVSAAHMDELERENTQLRSRLAFTQRTRFQTISASIIMRSITPQSRTFVIDRGSTDGIVVGAAVIAGDGILVGKISSVTAATATVVASTDPSSKIASTLLNHSRTIGLSEGGTASLMTLRYIPHDEPIAINDLVMSSGLETGIPAGLIVGMVNAVHKEPTAPFQEAIIEPPEDIRRLTSVGVLVNSL